MFENSEIFTIFSWILYDWSIWNFHRFVIYKEMLGHIKCRQSLCQLPMLSMCFRVNFSKWKFSSSTIIINTTTEDPFVRGGYAPLFVYGLWTQFLGRGTLPKSSSLVIVGHDPNYNITTKNSKIHFIATYGATFVIRVESEVQCITIDSPNVII